LQHRYALSAWRPSRRIGLYGFANLHGTSTAIEKNAAHPVGAPPRCQTPPMMCLHFQTKQKRPQSGR
ncbi:hypothetical protein JS562_16805, partial [Agrobacterium sp. S2]|nr:hypothetical protein [Agrobacterium sp. S2]